MKLTLEFAPIIGLDDMCPKGQTRKGIIHELDGRSLIDLLIDLQHSKARTVIDRRVLIITSPGSFDSF